MAMSSAISIGRQSNSISWERMKVEAERLRTFQDDWSPHIAPPSEFAKAGFFYYGESDHVQCTFCRGIIGECNIFFDSKMHHVL